MNNSGTTEIMVFSAITKNASKPRTGAGKKDNMSLRSPKQMSLLNRASGLSKSGFAARQTAGPLSKEAAHYATTERKLNREFEEFFVFFGHKNAVNVNNLPKWIGYW
ncbi:hypothetical protein [Ketobacter sp.]|uniref:hypothetical protein n=1 Tax=Ketobacter sp. TaxID=2083498 RepID=UPI0025B92578|nr:hypothetical protein [Ketobacter sp.]